jgi:hypothetical protein
VDLSVSLPRIAAVMTTADEYRERADAARDRLVQLKEGL